MALIMDNTTQFLKSDWGWDYEQPPKFNPLWIEHFDNLYWRKFMLENPSISFYACAVYLCVIYLLQKYMKNRPPIKSQAAIVSWNLFLAIFSFLGFYRISQELFTTWQKPDGLYKSLCVREGRNLPAAFWGLLFVFSKFIEFGDTVFIVLRKQNLLALQWYHHCLVTLFSWKLYPWNEPILAWYAFMNYGIHQFMYAYFTCRGLNWKVPEILAMCITSLQTGQMIFGIVINVYTMYMIQNGIPCSRHQTSINWSLGVYFSLWILFAKFFLDRYYSKKRAKKIN